MIKIAVLLTCHNRKEKTINCLDSFFNYMVLENAHVDIYLVDDNSKDGTAIAIKNNFPKVKIINGSGNLYWAGGMRLAYETAIKTDTYHAFLLLNDDVTIQKDIISDFLNVDNYAVNHYNKRGIYVLSTFDPSQNKISYGGWIVKKWFYKLKLIRVNPGEKEIKNCQITNANILWVSSNVTKNIGFLDKNYIHGFADYDFSYTVFKGGFPVLVAPNIGGYCSDDHGNSWKGKNSTLKERIHFLKSVTGLQYYNLLYFYKKHFPIQLPYVFLMLWLKTFFPILWDRFKNK